MGLTDLAYGRQHETHWRENFKSAIRRKTKRGQEKLNRKSDESELRKPKDFQSHNGGKRKLEDTRNGRKNLIGSRATLTSAGRRSPWPQRRKGRDSRYMARKLMHIGSRGNSHFGWKIGLGAAMADGTRLSAIDLT